MKTLRISNDLSLPLESVTQTIAVLAKRRAGKSYFMRRLTEQLLKRGQQVVIVDPKGDQWGIRSAADGKGPGLSVIILGGERGDVPLEPGSGELVAKLVVEERVSILLDLSLFRKHEVATFMTAFLENLYRLKAREIYRTPMMLVGDEFDAIAPQKPQKGEERMLGAAEDIVRRGGQRGIGCIMVTQRPAVLNKNVLTQAQMLVALRTIAPQDLAAMDAWIQVHGEPEQRKTLMESLPALPVGDAWFWSPGWPTVEGIFQRVHVLPIETFDSGATPKPGVKPVEPKHVADVDLEALKKQMADTIERAKADDPRALRVKIAELERQVKSKVIPTTVPTKIKTVEVPVIKDAQIKRIERAVSDFIKASGKTADAVKVMGEKAVAAQQAITALDAVLLPRSDEAGRQLWGTSVMERVSEPVAKPISEKPYRPIKNTETGFSLENNGTLPRGEHKVLTAIAQHQSGVTREQITVLTGYRRSSRDAYLQRLTGKAFIEVGRDKITATLFGVQALGPTFEPLPTGAALREYWMHELPAGEKKVLEHLLIVYPEGVDRTTLDEATGYKRSSRDAYLQRLTNRQLVVDGGRGKVKASPILF